jgi:pimeloyl-ACP methyl ester carboxylesterase
MMDIHFRELGKGEPIILIHGFCETLEIWNGFAEQLAQQGKVIAIDLPGFGHSPLPPTPFSIDDIARQVLAFLKLQNVRSPVMIGHSLGGYIVLAIMELDPGYSKKIILFHSSVYPDTEEKKANRNRVIDFVEKNGVAPFIQTFVPSLFYRKDHPAIPRVISIANQTPSPTLIAYTRAMRDRPSREEMIRKHPGLTVILCGDKDEIIPVEISRQMAAIDLRINLFVLPDTGHMGMIESPGKAISGICQSVQW